MADTYPELLTPAEFDPTTFPHDEDGEPAVVRHLPVRSQHRVGQGSPLRLSMPW